jgi:hypothetical protein
MSRVLRHYLITALSVAVNGLLAWLFAKGLGGAASGPVHETLLALATGLLLLAGIGGISAAMPTLGGTSAPEKLSLRIFYSLSHLGTFLLLLDIFLSVRVAA